MVKLLSRLSSRSRSPGKRDDVSLELIPKEGIEIDLDSGGSKAFQTAVLQHMGENMNAVFWKVRRADPKVVSLRPHRGVLAPGASVEIQVWVKDRQLVESLPFDKPAKVAFKCLNLPENVAPDEEELEESWEAAQKKDFMIKVRVAACGCIYIYIHPLLFLNSFLRFAAAAAERRQASISLACFAHQPPEMPFRASPFLIRFWK